MFNTDDEGLKICHNSEIFSGWDESGVISIY